MGIPNGSRGTIIGGVRILSATNLPPFSAMSVAISAPLFPGPTTRTRFPTNGFGFEYPTECDSWPRNSVVPGQRGSIGRRYCPVAMTTARAPQLRPSDVATCHDFGEDDEIRVTVARVTTFKPKRSAYSRRYATY